MQLKLKVLKGAQAGMELAIKGPRFLVGRGDDCHLKPKTDVISRNHCELVIEGPRVIIRDLKSRNGTHVNGHKIEADVELHAGDQLRIGPLEFEVLIDLGLAAAKQPPAQNVREVAARTVKSGSSAAAQIEASDSGIIGQWLNEADEITRTQRQNDPETRQFKLAETDRVKIDPAHAKEGAPAPSVTNTTIIAPAMLKDGKPGDETKADPKTAGKGDKKVEKKEPGKLPPVPSTQAGSSKEAAAQMLKKFFNKQ